MQHGSMDTTRSHMACSCKRDRSKKYVHMVNGERVLAIQEAVRRAGATGAPFGVTSNNAI